MVSLFELAEQKLTETESPEPLGQFPSPLVPAGGFVPELSFPGVSSPQEQTTGLATTTPRRSLFDIANEGISGQTAPVARERKSLFDIADKAIQAEQQVATEPPDIGMEFRLTGPGSVLEKPIERFQQGVKLGEAGMKSLLNVPFVPSILSGPAVIAEFLGKDPKKLGLDVPMGEQILPELPAGTPAKLRPFLEYIRSGVDPVIGGVAAVLGPAQAVLGPVSELLIEQPTRTAIKNALTKFKADPESVPIGGVLPIAIYALNAAGFTMDEKDIDAISESGATLAGVLFGVGIGNALLKTVNPASRALGRILGGEAEKPIYEVKPGEAPLLPRADTLAAKAKKFLTPKILRQDPEFNIAMSERTGRMTLGNMQSKGAFTTIDDSVKTTAKEMRVDPHELDVAVGNALKGEGGPLHPRLEKSMRAVRESINRWQQRAADVGLIPQEIVDNTVDRYLYRGYMAKLSPETWTPPQGVLDKAREFLKRDLRIPVERADPSRSLESVVLENVRRQMQTQFRQEIRAGRPDVGLAQRVMGTMKREILGNEKANLKSAREFLGTEQTPSQFRQILSDRLVEEWNLTPQQAAGTVTSAINALSRKTIAVDFKDLRGQMLRKIIEKEGIKPEIAGTIAKTIRDTREAFDDMGEFLVQTRKAKLTGKEVSILEKQFQDKLEKATGKGPVSFRNATRDEVEGAIEQILSGDDAFAFHAQQGGRSAKINLGPFTRRKDIPKEIRDLMGEINEGSTAAALTISNLSRAVESKRFLDRFAKGSEIIEFGGMKQKVPWVSDTRVPGYVKAEGKAWGPLDGKFILEKYADDLKGFTEAMEPGGWWSKLQEHTMNFFKFSKTAGNVPTHPRNIIGNFMFADYARNPVWNPMNWKYYTQAANELLTSGKGFTAKGLRSLKKGGGVTDEGVTPLVREMIEDGAINTELFGSEVFKDVVESYAKKNPMQVAFNAAKRPFRAMGRVYNGEDQIFKASTYLKNRAEGMSRQEAGFEARKWYPNFRDVAPVTEKARRSLFGAPFVSFYSEALRINVAAAKEHPIKFGKWIMLAPAMVEGARAAIGITRDRWEKVKASLPSYKQQPMEILVPWPDADGNIQTFDMTYLHPLGSMVASRQQGLQMPILGEFVLNNPILNTILEGVQNVNPLTGQESRKPGQPMVAWVTELLIKNFAPPLTPGIPGTEIEGGTAFREISRSIRRAKGEHVPGRFGQSPTVLRTLINELGPIRVTPVDANMLMAGLQEKKGDIYEMSRSIFTLGRAAIRGNISESTAQERAERIMRDIEKIVRGRQRAQGILEAVPGRTITPAPAISPLPAR